MTRKLWLAPITFSLFPVLVVWGFVAAVAALLERLATP